MTAHNQLYPRKKPRLNEWEKYTFRVFDYEVDHIHWDSETKKPYVGRPPTEQWHE